MISKELNIDEIKKIKNNLNPYIVKTPTIFNLNNISTQLNTEIIFKLEFLQHGGTFKARGALNNILNLSKKEKENGVIAFSAGNHAIAVAYASKIAKVNSKVIYVVFKLNFSINSVKFI